MFEHHGFHMPPAEQLDVVVVGPSHVSLCTQTDKTLENNKFCFQITEYAITGDQSLSNRIGPFHFQSVFAFSSLHWTKEPISLFAL